MKQIILYATTILLSYSFAQAQCLSYQDAAKVAWPQLLESDISRDLISFEDTFDIDWEPSSDGTKYIVRGFGGESPEQCDHGYEGFDYDGSDQYSEDYSLLPGYYGCFRRVTYLNIVMSCKGEVLSTESYELEDPL